MKMEPACVQMAQGDYSPIASYPTVPEYDIEDRLMHTVKPLITDPPKSRLPLYSGTI